LYALACKLANSSCISANLSTVTYLPVHCKIFHFFVRVVANMFLERQCWFSAVYYM